METGDMLVAEVMHPGVYACQPGTPVTEVARRMVDHDVSALVVTDDQGYLAGVVTRTDLITLRTFEDYWAELTAEHAMVRQVLTVSPQATVRQACNLMVENRIHRLVVVEKEEACLRPVGVVSQTDIVRNMAAAA